MFPKHQLVMSSNERSSLSAVFVLGAVLLGACAVLPPPNDGGAEEDERPHEDGRGPEPMDSPFCEAMFPVTRELQSTLGEGITCLPGSYSRSGSFGPLSDVTESTFLQACFDGLERYERRLKPSERQLFINTVVEKKIEIDRGGFVDLSDFGISPPLYQFQGFTGPGQAWVKVFLERPTISTVDDLGYKLKRFKDDSGTNESVKASVRSCMDQLCGEDTHYTADIISARPVVLLNLKRGRASRLRPTSSAEGVNVEPRSSQSFTIKPQARINLATRIRHSRNTMVGHRACGPGIVDEGGDTGEEEPVCDVLTRWGLELTLRGCRRSGRAVDCTFSVMSPDYGMDVGFYVHHRQQGSSFTDDRGVSHLARRASLAEIRDTKYIQARLHADIPADLVVTFENVPSRIKKISRLELRFRTHADLPIELENIKIAEKGEASCQGER